MIRLGRFVNGTKPGPQLTKAHVKYDNTVAVPSTMVFVLVEQWDPGQSNYDCLGIITSHIPALEKKFPRTWARLYGRTSVRSTEDCTKHCDNDELKENMEQSASTMHSSAQTSVVM